MAAQNTLEQNTLEQITDRYPLSPMQQGLLFNSLRGRERGTDITQVRCHLQENLDPPAMEHAWQKIVERHAIFRTAFRWQDLGEPQQEVHRSAPIAFQQQDWRDLPQSERTNRLEALAKDERQREFDVSAPPLMRLLLIRLGEEEFELLWTMHHLLLDARAFVVVLNEVFAFYEALRKGEELELPPLRPFQDFISWLQTQDWSKAEQFWSQKLNGFAAPTPLRIASGVKSSQESGVYAEQKLVIPESLTSALKGLAKENEFTMNTIVQGAWALLLNRYSGEGDVLFGAVRACRRSSIEGAESMVGLLINTVPVRVAVPPEMRVIAWLQQLRSQWIELRESEHTPLVKAQAASNVPAGEPLFETVVNVQEPSWESVLENQGGPWASRKFSIHSQPGYPLALDAYVGVGRDRRARHFLTLKITFDQHRFNPAVIERMLGHLQTVLQTIADQPYQALVSLPLLTASEQEQMLVKWNDTAAEVPRRCAHQLFETQAARAPQALAVADSTQQLTYAELNAQANALAHRLIKSGVGPGTWAGILMDRSVELVISELAVLKAGGAFVPLDPAYPKERLAFIIQDTAMPVLLMQDKFKDLLPPEAPQSIIVRISAPTASTHNPDISVTPSDLAYLIYTSGSTGTPKGVEIEHSGLVNLATWHQRAYSVTPNDRATLLASPAFDASVWELWPYLASGASIHIPPEDTRMSPQELIHWLSENHITICFLPTPLAEAVLGGPWPEHLALRALLTGGDKLHRRPKENLPFSLGNHYGPTENSVVTTSTVVSGGSDDSAPPIGRPIANTQTYILDQHLRPVPIGVPGELHVSGVGLARGYWRQPGLTAEKFIRHPFSSAPKARLYKTGDRACYRPDGQIEFLGRLDNQIKIRGFRIELGEIETACVQHPAVQEAVVVARDNRLVGYIVPKPNANPAAAELSDFLKQKIPGYMIPTVWLSLPALPLTPNGKINRQALPEPDRAFNGVLGTARPAFVSPRTPTEEILAGLYGLLLDLNKVGINSHFFQLGGHSLLVMQAVSRIRSLFQIELPVQALFDFPVLKELARQIDLLQQNRATPNMPPLKPRGPSAEPVISSAQERLWFLEQLDPGRPVYNIPLAFEIKGALDVNALQQSLSEIVRRHAPFRTTFRSAKGRPAASIAPAQLVQISHIDLTALPEPDREAETQRRINEEARRPFDLSQSPLLRVQLLHLGPERHLLNLTMHHIASDGWSMSIFFRELSTLYSPNLNPNPNPNLNPNPNPNPLPSLPITYSDYAHWQRQWLSGEAPKTQLAYWKKQLSGKLPVLNLPTDRPRPSLQTYRGATQLFQFDAEFSEAMKKFSRSEGVTLFMTMLAAVQTLLHRYSGQEDILIGSPVAGRNRSEVEDLIGLFVNTLVFRGYPAGEMTFRQLLEQTRKTALEAFAHQDLPFEKLVEALPTERDLSRSPIFQIMFVLQNTPLTSFNLPGVRFTPRHVHSGTAKFDLTLVLEEGPQTLQGYVEYNTDLFEPATVARLPEHLKTLLAAAIQNPEQPLRDLPLLSEPERRQLLVEWNQTQTQVPSGVCIHHLFESQVSRTPEAVAVVCEEEQLTYAELNRRANHLAHQLQRLGIGPESLVGICVERSLEMIIGLLAILKAGAAYVPLDPSYPKERLQFMVQDSEVSVLLTQEKFTKDFALAPDRVLCLDQVQWPWTEDAPSGQNLFTGVTSDHLAYVIYTSGSTGKPKGVMLAHRNVVNFFAGMDQVLGTEPGVWLAVTSICFDISVLELFWTLCRGFKIVIQADGRTVPARGTHPAKDFSIPAQIECQQVTHLQCTPSLATMLLQEPKAPEALRKLKKLLLGGEALPASLVHQLQIGGQIINMYGPTETTVWSTSHPVTQSINPIPIGRPIANTEIYILDEQLQPVPRGVPGEIFIGGEGVARGYLNRPDLTAQRFIPDPFTSRPGARLYRTGDLARYLPDGQIEFLGRLDHQVKIRGFRIELGEIEAALRPLEEVRDCVVVLREITTDDKRLMAYIVPRPPLDPKPLELRRYLQARLPDYMVPSVFVVLEQLPLTPNGKIDRKALPQPELLRTQSQSAYVPAQTDLEKTIAALWQELLRVQQVGLHDNFFDLGGHSLLMVQAHARLTEAFSIDLPVLTLFQYPTISALAKHLAERSADNPVRSLEGNGDTLSPVLPKIHDRARRQRAMFAGRS